jgi:hypothetical protein
LPRAIGQRAEQRVGNIQLSGTTPQGDTRFYRPMKIGAAAFH